MTDHDFIVETTSLLARCSPTQLQQLAERARTYGTSGGAEDRSGRPGARASLSLDHAKLSDPDAGKSFAERFPNAHRLAG